jgi:hypothetical protein
MNTHNDSDERYFAGLDDATLARCYRSILKVHHECVRENRTEHQHYDRRMLRLIAAVARRRGRYDVIEAVAREAFDGKR